MTFDRVKLERAVTFMKHIARVVSLMSLPETFIWNKATFPELNSLNLAR